MACLCMAQDKVKTYSLADGSIYTQLNYDFGRAYQQEFGLSFPLLSYKRWTLNTNFGVQYPYPIEIHSRPLYNGSLTFSYSFK